MEALSVLLLVFILACAVAVSLTKDLLTSIIIFMAQSTAMSVVWILLRSPDLAITEAAVVGVPDAEWGQAVALVAVTSPGGPPVGPVPDAGVGEIREMLRPHLETAALPRRVVVVAEIPARGPGKPDRAAVARLVTG